MRPAAKFLGMVVFAFVYVAIAIVYEFWVVKTVIWWWAELLRYREIFTTFQALVNFAWVAGSTFMLVPYFVWLPIWLLKEIVWWLTREQPLPPYEAKPYTTY